LPFLDHYPNMLYAQFHVEMLNLVIWHFFKKTTILTQKHTCHNSFGPNRDFCREFGLDIGIFRGPF
jgi:hypothetical protein